MSVHLPSQRIISMQLRLVPEDEKGDEYEASVFVNEIPEINQIKKMDKESWRLNK